jgi:hydrogenase maturation protease
MPRALIIAYGNPLRSDDGLAWVAAESLREQLPREEVEILCLQQLGPELADPISACECVVFIDAAGSQGAPGKIQIQQLSTETTGPIPLSSFCHAVAPDAILRLTAQLYHAKPKAFSATIVGENFEHGELLSPAVREAIPVLERRIADLIESTLRKKAAS